MLAFIMIAAFWCVLQASEPASGATAPITVSLQAASVTTLDMTACISGTPQTSIGVVLPMPGVVARNSVPCTVGFGSSNANVSLRVRQEDGTGDAMHASPTGDLDSKWGVNGYKEFSNNQQDDNVYDVATGIDGSIFMVGETCGTCIFTVSKLLPGGILDRSDGNGTLDPSFGTGGFRELSELESSDSVATSIVIQADGKLVIAGYDVPGSNRDLLLVRLDPVTGDLDTTFGAQIGWTHPVSTNRDDSYFDVQLQLDGRILALGSIGGSGRGFSTVILDRFLSDGRVDTSFGSNGRLTLPDYAPGGKQELARQFVVRPDNSLDILLDSDDVTTGQTLRVVHASKDGVIDTTWAGGTGAASWNSDNNRWDWSAQAITRQPDGKLVIVNNDEPTDRARVTRLKPDGTLDTSFNSTGTRVISFVGGGPDVPTAVSWEPGGKLLIAAIADNGDHFGAVRLNSDGSTDTDFATNGFMSKPIDNDIANRAHIAHFADGRVALLVGTDPSGPDTQNEATWVMDAPAVKDYDKTNNNWASGNSAFGICLNSLTGTTALATWQTDLLDPSCPTTDDGLWRAVPQGFPALGPATVVGIRTTSLGADAVAKFTFGLHADTGLKPGLYEARLAFEVTAP